jgi:hypothetical protein
MAGRMVQLPPLGPFLQQGQPFRPVAVAAGCVEVAGVANHHQLTAPGLGKLPGTGLGHPLIGGARDHFARKRQPLQRHRPEAGGGKLGVVRGFDVARGHQQCALDAVAVGVGPVRHRGAAQAVGDEHHLAKVFAGQGLLQRFDPLGTVGGVPFALLDAGKIRVLALKIRLPMGGAGAAQAGHHEEAGFSLHSRK